MINVMIVEDEPAAMSYITSLIRSRCSGLEIVAQAEDGTEAVKILAHTQVDILITDVQMTHMNGVELAQWVNSSGLDIITLIISGHSDFEYAKGALKAGVVEYLLKPINPSTFVDTMDELSKKALVKQQLKREMWLRKAVAGTPDEDSFPGLNPNDTLLIGVLIIGGGESHFGTPKDGTHSLESPIGDIAATYIHRDNEICFAIHGEEDSDDKDKLINILTEGTPYHSIVLKEAYANESHVLPDMLKSARDMMDSGICQTHKRHGESGKLASDIETYISEHLGEPMSTRSICDVFNISASYLTQLFRKHINKSFVEYLTEQRIDEAKKMMDQNPHLPIRDIAEQLGFSDQFYFSKVFRSVTGIPPSEYRK